MSFNLRITLAISATIHALFLWLLVSGNSGGLAKGGGLPSGPSGTIVQFAPETNSAEEKDPQGVLQNKTSRDCASWYGGVGIVYMPNGLITDVVPNYPAYKADIRQGDIILNLQNDDVVAGAVGSATTYKLFRPSTNARFQVTLVREKICTEM